MAAGFDGPSGLNTDLVKAHGLVTRGNIYRKRTIVSRGWEYSFFFLRASDIKRSVIPEAVANAAN